MKLRKLGSSNLAVSEISLGSWLNFFDTANVYGRGAAETAWGEIPPVTTAYELAQVPLTTRPPVRRLAR